MDKSQVALLAHPLTLMIFGLCFSGVGALITMLFSMTKDNARFKEAIFDLKEMVKVLYTQQGETSADVQHLKDEFNRVKGQHDMILQGKDLLKKHG